MVQKIDFLPASYHQDRQKRQRRLLVRGVLLACLGLIAAATFQQRHARARLSERRDRLQSQAQLMLQQIGSAVALRQKIDRLETRANLVTALRMQARPTRILAAVTDSLPRFVSITEFSLASATVGSASQPVPEASAKDAAKKLTPEQRDLQRITTESQETARFVSVQGIAPDDVAISDYLAALMAAHVFDEVTLLFTDQHRYREHSMRSFGIRLRIRRPWGGNATIAALAEEAER